MTTISTREERLVEFAKILHEVADVNPEIVTESADLTDELGIDSLSMVEVMIASEEAFGLTIPDEAFGQLKTVGDVLTYLSTTDA